MRPRLVLRRSPAGPLKPCSGGSPQLSPASTSYQEGCLRRRPPSTCKLCRCPPPHPRPHPLHPSWLLDRPSSLPTCLILLCRGQPQMHCICHGRCCLQCCGCFGGSSSLAPSNCVAHLCRLWCSCSAADTVCLGLQVAACTHSWTILFPVSACVA